MNELASLFRKIDLFLLSEQYGEKWKTGIILISIIPLRGWQHYKHELSVCFYILPALSLPLASTHQFVLY